MLVVSRKENQAVIFPALGISVKIQRIGGKAVSVGVEAPRNVRVLRGELMDQEDAQSALDSVEPDAKAKHELRNQLNKANLALQLISKQLSAGLIDDAEESLALALGNLSDLDRGVTGNRTGFELPKTEATHQPRISHQRLRGSEHCWWKTIPTKELCWLLTCEHPDTMSTPRAMARKLWNIWLSKSPMLL